MSRKNNNNNDFDVSVGSEFVTPEDASKICNRLRGYAGLIYNPDLIISRICNEFSHISEHRIREILRSCGVYSRNWLKDVILITDTKV